jgi:hypothetical protein
MLTTNSAAPRGGLLFGLIFGLLVLLILAIVMLPVLLVLGGLGVLAFAALKLNRWLGYLGQSRAASPISGEDFDSLRARLEQRGSATSYNPSPEDSADTSHSNQVDDLGRRNVRVITNHS